ncbi:MAG: ATP-grasp domain-containing protein [Planctomycetes bacterium]|nr:ATP-grasp domain-containing protein [Planctomycetota bacterium]
MPTLLLSRTCQPEAGKLAQMAKAAGWQHQWLRRQTTPHRLHGDDFAYYGETDLALRVMRRHRLVLIEPRFDLLARLPRQYTKRRIVYMTLGDALELSERAFVKPADCTNKAFDAAVWESGKYILCTDDLSRQTAVLVSEPVSWDVEYRVIVLERQAITFSPYIRGGWLARNGQDQWPYPEDEAAEMLDFCRQLLADSTTTLPPVFTLDVGIIEGRGWAVVEFNPLWCSGLLGCDLSNVLPALHRACCRPDQLSDADAEWVINRSAEATA